MECYFAEVAAVLKRCGYTVGESRGEVLEVKLDDRPLCLVTDEGGVRYRKEDLGSADRVEAMHSVAQSARATAEYMQMMEQAPSLKASGLEGDYRILADFNGVVLAGHPTQYGVQFVTWNWDLDRKGVSLGHYYSSDYAGAKQDFATRAGLVERQRLFSDEQLTEIYRCVSASLNEDMTLTAAQEDLLSGIQEQISAVLPDVAERLKEAQQSQQAEQGEMTMY